MYKDGHVKQGGRKKGTENKLSGDLRQMMTDFLNSNHSQFIEDFKGLKPVERCKIYRHCLQVILPRLSAVNIESGPEPIGEIRMISVRKKLVDKLGENYLNNTNHENEN